MMFSVLFVRFQTFPFLFFFFLCFLDILQVGSYLYHSLAIKACDFMSQFLKCCVPWLRQKSFDVIWLDKGAKRKELWRSLPKMRGEKKIASHRLFWLTPAFFFKISNYQCPLEPNPFRKKKVDFLTTEIITVSVKMLERQGIFSPTLLH